MTIEYLALAMAACRVLIGIAPIGFAGTTAKLLGIPEAHDNPSARLFARLFGVRDAALGVLVVAATQGVMPLSFAFLFNAAIDLGDACMIAIPLVRRDGIDRAAIPSLVLATSAACCWVGAWAWVSA